ncbi:MAG: flagellar assembly protein FliW [Lachnospiraceae bacterium]|nr:flagellar assembly protein FliW [Lachnospiraceae bacterium]
MVRNTRLFGEVTIDDSKMIHFPGGIVGFPDLQDFALIHDTEQGENGGIHWMQSVQEPNFAMPVIDPLRVKPDYNPEADDELLSTIGEINPDELLVLVTITVPSDLTKMTVNLKAPFVINVATRKACQVIVEGYEIKFPIYDILQKMKKEGE